MKLLQGDCLEKLKELKDNSIDICIADPPYGRFKHLDWDVKIEFKKLWKELWRVCKPTCPIFLFGDFKFAVEIYNSQPKWFKYEIVWNKMRTTTPLLSRKRFGKATEYILVFYKKQPVYNYLKYHKYLKAPKRAKVEKQTMIVGQKPRKIIRNQYDPKLPINVVNQVEPDKKKNSMYIGGPKDKNITHVALYDPKLPINVVNEPEDGYDNKSYDGVCPYARDSGIKWDPKLPINVLEGSAKINNKTIKKITEKPQFLLEHLLKYFSNEGDTCLDFCMGSGSCGVACKTLNRNFVGIELNKEHFNLAKKRLI